MKKLLALFLSSFVSTQLWAVNPVPYTVPVMFSEKVTFTSPGEVLASFYAEGGAPTAWYNTSGESLVQTAWLRPGKKYDLNYYGAGASDYWLSFTAPDGYALYINGQRSTLITRTGLGGATFDENAEMELRPVSGGGRLDFGTFTGISVGESITWEIGLGGFPLEGRSAGRIVFKERDLMYYPIHVDRLYYTAPDSYGFTETIYNYPGSQTLRQVKVPQGIVDFIQESNGYSIRFYASGQFNIVSSLYEFSVAPWKTIQVEASNSMLKITETENGVSRVSRLELTSGSVSTGNYQWTLQEGQTGSTWLRTSTYTSVNGVVDNGVSGREMTVVANPGGQSGTAAAKTLYRFENKAGNHYCPVFKS